MGNQALAVLCAVAFARVARADTASEAKARELYQEGVKLYDLAEYPRAIEDFKAAYELSPAPRLLFDIAQAYRLSGAGNCRNAVQFYKTYLRNKPDAENRKAVEQWMHELAPCVEREKTEPAPAPNGLSTSGTPTSDAPPTEAPPTAPPPTAPPPAAAPPTKLPAASPAPVAPPSRVLRWSLLAGGAGVALAGGGVLAWVAHDFDAGKQSCRPSCAELRDRLSLRADVAYALAGVGSAAVIAGAILWIRGGEPEPALYVAPSPAGVAIGGRF